MTSISLTSGEILDIVSLLADKVVDVYLEDPHLSAYYLKIQQQFDTILDKLDQLPGEKRVANLVLAMP
jgi:hypothetical protein